MEELYEEGKVRAIGVDNFTQDRMADFLFFKTKENLDIFDFSLTENEMVKISTLDTGHTYAAERNTGKAVTEFLEKARAYHV